MLNYKQLYYFWQVAKQGITRAAEHLHLTPQTLSGQISELERTLGTALFVRTGRRNGALRRRTVGPAPCRTDLHKR